MAVDMFLKLDSIKGEAQDKTHGGEVDVLAWSWGVSNGGTLHVGGGGGAGKANFQDLSITKYVDKASPVLLKAVTTGKHIKSATLTVRKAGDKPLEYIVINLDDILVTSISTGGSGGEDRLTENVSLNFARVGVKYSEQKTDGSGAPAIPYNWDIPKHDEWPGAPK